MGRFFRNFFYDNVVGDVENDAFIKLRYYKCCFVIYYDKTEGLV